MCSLKLYQTQTHGFPGSFYYSVSFTGIFSIVNGFYEALMFLFFSSRELVIAFVYDTQKCTQEADDPQDAVLFFHPGWVSEQQRLALCGQLMGATYFLLASFSPPRILSLQSGKFAIRTFGRYVVVSMAFSLKVNLMDTTQHQNHGFAILEL